MMKRLFAFLLVICLLLCGTLGVCAADKVYALTMGVHKHSANNTVSDGASVATVRYTRLKTGETGSADKIFDVASGEEFDLTSTPVDGQEDYYTFIGWFDGNGVLISQEATLHVVFTDKSQAFFAGYAEAANRCVFTYLCTSGEGKLSVSSDKPLQQGDQCASVVCGANVTVSFAPAKNYITTYLRVNGRRVSMTANTARMLSLAVKSGKIKDVFNALVNYVKYWIGKEAKFTVENVTCDTTFEVGFIQPIKL